MSSNSQLLFNGKNRDWIVRFHRYILKSNYCFILDILITLHQHIYCSKIVGLAKWGRKRFVEKPAWKLITVALEQRDPVFMLRKLEIGGEGEEWYCAKILYIFDFINFYNYNFNSCNNVINIFAKKIRHIKFSSVFDLLPETVQSVARLPIMGQLNLIWQKKDAYDNSCILLHLRSTFEQY